MRRLLLSLLSICALLGFAQTVSAQQKKPNVVFILIDDLNHYGVSAYGADKIISNLGRFQPTKISTPRIDKLAEQGLMCNNAFAYPICEPTRIALMSGQTNNRNFLRCKSQHASDITFGDAFKRAGYATGVFGKWKQTRGTKEIKGKDYIYEFGWDEFACFDVTMEGQRFINPNLVINGKVKNYNKREDLDPETGRRWYGPDICNRYALDFIEKHKDEPFFLYYPMLLVHDDHKPTPDTKPNHIFDNFDEAPHNRKGHSGDDHRYFPDMIKYMDKLIGKVVDKIDALGLRENTLIVVMGDNGTKESFSHGFPDGKIYHGRKGGNADNGIHVPLVLSMPKSIPTGEGNLRRYDGLVNITDIYPTIAEAAGVEIPNKEQMDGKSFWQQTLGKENKEHRDVIYTWFNGNNPYTSEETVIEYAFNKEFKRYSPSVEFPEGRFFDLRTDSLERGGDKMVEARWHIYRYSGLRMNELTSEQKKAYDELGKVLEENQMKHVENLKIVNNNRKIKRGKTYQLGYQTFPTNATRRNIVWDSSDPTIATVDKFGNLKTHKKGKVTISIYSWDDAFPVAANIPETFSKKGIKDKVEIVVK